MKNKIIAALMIGSLALQSGFCVMADDERSVLSDKDQRVMDFISSMGYSRVLIDEMEEISPDTKITRAEFAVVLSEVCGLEVGGKGANYFQEIFSNNDKDENLITDSDIETCFDDIQQGHWAYDYVERVKSYGLMNGVSETEFNPEGAITLNQATKAIERALNYSVMAELNGGYPQGYAKIAKDIKLWKNINKTGDEEIDWITVQHLMYNALHTAVLEESFSGRQTSFSDRESEMLITKLYDINIIEGIVRDNGISSLTGNSVLGENQVKIGDTVLFTATATNYVKEKLGHSMTVYYYNDDADKSYEIVYADCAEKENEVFFDVDDFDSMDTSYMNYYVNEKLRKTKLAKTPYVIVNGEAVREYDSSLFDFDNGNIGLIAWDGESANVIVVNKKEYIFVDKMNTENEIIYNKIRTTEPNNLNVLDLSQYNRVTIKTESGEDGEISDILVKDVLEVTRGERNIVLAVSQTVVEEFTVKSIISEKNVKQTISNGDTEYKVVPVFLKSVGATELKNGKTYTLYLNKASEVVWAETAVIKGENSAGILTKVGMTDDEGEEEWYIKVYTGNKEFDRYYFEEKFDLNGKRVKVEDKENLEYIDDYYSSLILFKLNENNKITSITTPADYGDRSNRGLYRMNTPGKTLNYHIQTTGLGLNMFINGSTVKFTAPLNEELREDVSGYAIGQAGFSDNTPYMVDGYTTKLDDLNAEYIIAKQEVKSGTYDSKCMVIDSISQTIDEDDQPCYKITGYTAKYETAVSYKEFIVEADVKFIDVNSNAVANMTVEDLTSGDIIRYNTNQKDNINTIFRVYDRINDSLAPRNSSNGNQFTRGWAYSYNNGYLRISADGVKPENVDFSKVGGQDESNIDLKGYRAGNTKIVVIDTSKKKPQISQGTSADIITYIDTMSPDNYSKVVVLSEWTFNAYLIAVYN